MENIANTIQGIVIMAVLISFRFQWFLMFQNPQIMCLLTPHVLSVPDSSLISDEN
jgi:hypothetical protein